jgi:hypothetical protein
MAELRLMSFIRYPAACTSAHATRIGTKLFCKYTVPANQHGQGSAIHARLANLEDQQELEMPNDIMVGT